MYARAKIFACTGQTLCVYLQAVLCVCMYVYIDVCVRVCSCVDVNVRKCVISCNVYLYQYTRIQPLHFVTKTTPSVDALVLLLLTHQYTLSVFMHRAYIRKVTIGDFVVFKIMSRNTFLFQM